MADDDLVQIVLPVSATAWAAMVDGLRRRYPQAIVLMDGPPGFITIRPGELAGFGEMVAAVSPPVTVSESAGH